MLRKILPRYITIEIVKTFLFTFTILSLIFFLILSMQILHKYSQYISLIEVIAMAPFILGRCITFTIPLSMLAATTLFYGRMAHDKEILILRSSGIHLHRMFQPAIIIGTILSLLCLYINGEFVPYTLRKQKEIRYRALEAIVRAKFSEEETTVDYIPRWRIYYRKLKDGKFHDLVIQHTTKDHLKVVEEILASEGNLEYDKEEKVLTFHLYNGSIGHITRSKNNSVLDEKRLTFQRISFPIQLERGKKINYNRDKFKNMKKLSRDTKLYFRQMKKVEKQIALLSQSKEANSKAETKTIKNPA